MNYFILAPLFSVLLSMFVVSMLVINKGYHSKQGKVFIFFVGALILWAIGDIGVFSASTEQLALIWAKFVSFSALVTTSLLLYYSLLYKRDDSLLRPWAYAVLAFVLAVYLGFSIFTDYISVGVQDAYWGNEIIRGPLYAMYSLNISAYIIASFFVILSKRRLLKNKKERKYSNLILWGLGLTFLPGFVSQVVMPAAGYKVMPLSSSAISILVLFVGYGILKHRLLIKQPFKSKSITTRIFWSIFLGGSTFVLMVFIPFFFYLNTSLVSDKYDDLDVYTHNKADTLQDYINERKTQISTLTNGAVLFTDTLNASNAGERDGELLKKTQNRLKGLVENDENLKRLTIINAKGLIIASSEDSIIGKDVSSEECYLDGLQGTCMKGLRVDEEGSIFHPVSSTIKDSAGTSVGVMVGHFSNIMIEDILGDSYGLGDFGETYIINKENQYVSTLRYLEDSFGKDVTDGEHNICGHHNDAEGHSNYGDHDNESVLNHLNYAGVEVLSNHKVIDEVGWCLVAEVNKEEFTSELNRTFGLLTAAMFTVITLVSFLATLLGRRISRPIKELNKDAIKISEGDFGHEINVDTEDELAELSDSFNKMKEEIIDSYKDVNKKVKSQTKNIEKQTKSLEDQQAAIMNILEDVEEEKAGAESAANDLKKFELAVANASDLIVITDADGLVLYANEALSKITGFSQSEVVGKKAGSKSLWGGLMEKAFYEKLWEKIKDKREVFIGEIKNKRKSGEEFIAATNISPITDSNNKVIFFVNIQRDVTKEREVDQAKTEFVSLASHQLRTPLSAINWYTEMLLNKDAGEVNDEQRGYLEEIYKGNQRMVDLVNSLLNVSRLELGTFEIKPEMVDLKSVGQDVLKELAPSIRIKRQEVVEKYGSKMPKAKVDKKLIRIILQNLLSNAVKYTPNRGKVTLEISSSAKGHRIKVSDTGYGIPKNQHDRVFSKLFRADNVRAMDTEGTGLGLYIIKSILDHSGGKISFTSAKNKGTTFVVELPKSGMNQKSGTKSLD